MPNWDKVVRGWRVSRVDKAIGFFDRALRAVAGVASSAERFPESNDADMSPAEREEVIGMMRVNHAGEVCAQSLYLAQAMIARGPELREHFLKSAEEEAAHLAWMRTRLAELGGRRSFLDPLWFAGASGIALLAAAAGDRTSLAFLRETERQVGEHLAGHLKRLPAGDERSRAMLSRMRDDELAHAQGAEQRGGPEMPMAGRVAMRAAARVMTGIAAYV